MEFETLVKCKLAQDKNTPIETLIILSKDKDFDVRCYVARNPNTPSEALITLSKDEDSYVKSYVANNPNTSIETLITLSKDEDSYVRESAAKNLNIRSTETKEDKKVSPKSMNLDEVDSVKPLRKEVKMENVQISRAKQAGYNLGAKVTASFIKTQIVELLQIILKDELGEKTDSVVNSIKTLLDTKFGEALISFGMSLGLDNVPIAYVRENEYMSEFANSLGTNSYEKLYEVAYECGIKLVPKISNMIKSITALPIPGISSVKEKLRVAAEDIEDLSKEEIAEKIVAFASQKSAR